MKTVRVTSDLQGQVLDVDGTLVNIKGETDTLVPVDLWLGIKQKYREHVHMKNHLIYAASEAEESEAEAEFRAACFAEFEKAGIPAIKALLDSGEIKSSVKSLLASEWLIKHSEDREVDFLSEARKSSLLAEAANSLSKEANLLSKEANSRASLANWIALITAVITIPTAIMMIITLMKTSP
jgi:hypothetical protein